MKYGKTQGNIAGKSIFARVSRSVAFAFVGVWITTPAASAQTAPPAEQVFKNIQAFKGVPSDQLLPLMQFISGSLGVHCDHCHQGDEAKRDDDSKPQKVMARKMIQMVSDINKASFGGRTVVSCYTCHRGNARVSRPVAFVPDPSAPVLGRGEKPPVVTNPPVEEVLAKYTAALGGADVVEKAASMVQKGTMTEAAPGEKPNTLPIEIYSKAPGKYAAVTHVKSGEAIGIYNGNTGWFSFSGTRLFLSGGRLWDYAMPFEPQRAMRGDEIDGAQLGDIFSLVGKIKQMVTGLRVTGTERLGDQEAYVVAGRTKNLPAVRFYFNKSSGLLARQVNEVDTPLGPIPHQVDYSDYRDVNGMKVPFQWTAGDIRDPQYIYKMAEIQLNVAIDESRFAKPSAAPASR